VLNGFSRTVICGFGRLVPLPLRRLKVPMTNGNGTSACSEALKTCNCCAAKDLRKVAEKSDLANADPGFLKALNEFIRKFGDFSCPVSGAVACNHGPEALMRLVLEMASHPPLASRDPVPGCGSADRFLPATIRRKEAHPGG
jgi:hypothetical protein